MQKDIGIGVIGLGMGRLMLAINNDPHSRLVVRAICDTDPARLAQVQAEHHIAFATPDYREMLMRDDISVVGIYSPDHLHMEHIAAAVSAGKHIICTKPMVVSLEQAQRTVDLVRGSGLRFLVGQTCRFVPQFVAAKKLFDEGDLGRPLLAEAHYVHDMRPVFDATPWRVDPHQDLMYGGVCHPVDLLRWFLGDVDEVFAYASQSNLDPRYPWADNFVISLRFKNGVIARVLGLFGAVEPPLPMLSLGIYGSRGSVCNESIVLDKIEGKPSLRMAFPAEASHGLEVQRYMRHFEECLLHDARPLIDEVEGARCIATCAACWESARSGLPVRVHNDF